MKILSEKNVFNNQVISKEKLEELLSEDTSNIYEVIRVINRKPVFLKEHFNRMKESIKLSNTKGEIDFDIFKNSIKLLIDVNNFENLNVRVSYYYKGEPVLLFYFIESYYPAKEMIKRGVHTVTAKIQRNNPNIKSYKKDFKDKVNKIISESNAFEVILINEDNTISEGSRSNIFFVEGKKLVTSPDELVLLGVTREKLIELCENNGIKVEKRIINYDELDGFDAAFITGTSNDVLPIRTIDKRVFNSSENEIVKRAYELYLDEVKKEIK